MIELVGLRQSFESEGNRTEILRGIDLRLNDGEFLVILGTNGSGKSTLLNAIAGTIGGVTGTIRIGDDAVERMPAYQRARYLARVFQNPQQGTAGDLTVAENLRLADLRPHRRRLRRGLNRAARNRYAEALAACGIGLEHRLDQPVRSLSGGQRQAVTLVMATLQRPKVLLLDEHTAALDPQAARVVMEFTERVVRAQGITTLMVTHAVPDSVRYGDRAVLLHAGQIRRTWAAAEKARLSETDVREAFGALYAESPIVISG
ncbi:MAG: ATP-binding cassette domain-containing protein [Fimbriimonadaceae bacterium]|nr:ATP-binding cassette domain-containing protein [Fimbriimonadaceae bacterium]